MRKPRLFIASSAESLEIAEAVNVNLDHEFEVTIWKNGTFKLSSSTIDDLIEKSSTVDFALFIFAPDDIATIRSRKEHIVRDNVLFEMGLFIGAIGKERSFILKPRDAEMHLPTDLLGTNPADYDSNRSDGDLVSATNRACSLIKSEVERIGLINYASLSETKRIQANPSEYELSEVDFGFLASCLQSHTSDPGGLAFHQITSNLRHYNDALLQISAIKLVRMGLLEKTVLTDEQYDHDYYSYIITELGIDTLLKNEEQLHPKPLQQASQASITQAFDKDIPF
ncbi:TIR domain-containing protein [Agarivorans aestuarii]|uniref:TIR domain-containing protein n=1 Tax=Agarivorans aestuarii TaxID=1563703 RepID=UPI001C7EF1C5|nr:nucleotide-binding protein [Agarivorans aestuarii]